MRPKLIPALAFVGTLCYPLIVYFAYDKIPALAFVIFGLSMIAIRLLTTRNKIWSAALLAAIIFLSLIFLIDAHLAVKAYPVIISLSFAALFAFSLFHPPTIIERIARLTEPDLPPEGVAYTRKVTIAWVIFLLTNAAVSAVSAVWGTLEQWTLWNSLLSYVAMGIMFAVEYTIRKSVRR